jgi:uncharacterized membrane protein
MPAIGALAVAGAALRFVRLEGQSFWYDEAVSAELGSRTAWDLLSGRARDLGNPPLHPLLLHFWGLVFGTGDGSLRALSAVLGALCVPVLFSVARRMVGDRRGALAAAIFAVAPLHVYLAQEARAFALLTLLGLVSIQQLQRAIESPSRWRWWIGWALATAGALYAHYYAFFLLAGEALWVAAQPRGAAPARRRFLTALAGVFLLYGPWIPSFLVQLAAKGNLARSPESWYLHALATPFTYVAGVTLVWKDHPGTARLVLAGLVTLAALGACWAGLSQLRRERRLLPLLCWGGVPVLLPLALSVAATPIYNVRYVAFAAPPFYVAVAVGLVSLRPWWRRACVLVLGAGVLVSLVRYFTLPVKHDWRSATAYVEEHAAPSDLVLFEADFNETAYAHYATAAQPRIRLLPPPTDTDRQGIYGVARPGEPLREVSATVNSQQRVWLVVADPDPRVDARLRGHFALGWHAKDRASFKGIELLLFTRGQ